jgi:hypothetical protein
MDESAPAVLRKPPFREIEWLERDIAVERRSDGVIVLKSRIPFYEMVVDGYILDDWGLAPLTSEQRRDLLEVVDDRHQCGSTILK